MDLSSEQLQHYEDLITKAKLQLILLDGATFITSVCYSLKHIISDQAPTHNPEKPGETSYVPTACTDGISVYYNPDFLDNLSLVEIVGLTIHETWHVALGHCGMLCTSRFQNMEPKRLNDAMDYVINSFMVKAGFTLPAGGLIDMKYYGMSTEEVYKLLPPESSQPNPMQGDVMPALGGNPTDADILKMEMELSDRILSASVRAASKGEKPGDLPGEIQVRINKMLKPQINWRKALYNYFNSKVKHALSFTKRNRRYPKVILPSRHSDALGDVAMVFDMSGSVSDEETSQHYADVSNVMSTVKLGTLTLAQFDTTVFQVDVVKTKKDMEKINFRGRGGTRISPVMHWAAGLKPDVLVIFTDGYFTTCTFDPGVPVIWIIYDNPSFSAPYGRILHAPSNRKR